MERKKPGRRRSQEPQKGIWIAVKDNAVLVTAILALFGVLITGAINTYIANKDQLAQQKLEVFNAQRQREVEEQKAQDAALQTYLDQMGQMLLNKNLRSSEEGSDVRTLTRARTLTTLRRLDPSRKTAVVRFLVEANLVQRVEESSLISSVISLANADLRGTDLSNADLFSANLALADLSGASLINANFSNADLFGASLSDANLSRANLSRANLSRADLSRADLSRATLNQADLSGANLSDANLSDANLGFADLTGARGVTEEQLDACKSLKDATMPDGSKHP